MESKHLEGAVPKLYGSVTVGERGQVVIPVEARKEYGLEPGAKLLVFSGLHPSTLVLARAEAITESLSGVIAHLAQLENMLRTDAGQPGPTD